MALIVHNQIDFSEKVISLVEGNETLTYLEAIMIIAEQLDVEVERIGELLTTKVKNQLYRESAKRNMFPGIQDNPLPFFED